MSSKLVTDKQKVATMVSAIVDTQSSTLETALQQSLATYGDQDLPARAPALASSLIAILGAAKQAMVEADEAHEIELDDDSAERDARDAAAKQLSDAVVGLRSLLEGLYGQAMARSIFGGATPRDPVVLARFAGESAKKLRSAEVPASRTAAFQVDLPQAATELDTQRNALESQLESVIQEQREAQATLHAKTRAIENFDRVLEGTSLILTGLFALAGQDDLADKVRPTTRRSSKPATQSSSASDATT